MWQALWMKWGAERGYPYHLLIVNSTISDSKWNDAKFCLAPAGDGWGIRMGKSAVLNCLPLIAQPYVMQVTQAFEDVLPYENFSRRIAFEQVPQLLSILRSVKAPQVADMRAVLEKMKPAFLWERTSDGLAYEYARLSLCHRAAELRGGLASGGDCTPLTYTPLASDRVHTQHFSHHMPGALPHRRWPSWWPATLTNHTRRTIEMRQNCYHSPTNANCSRYSTRAATRSDLISNVISPSKQLPPPELSMW